MLRNTILFFVFICLASFKNSDIIIRTRLEKDLKQISLGIVLDSDRFDFHRWEERHFVRENIEINGKVAERHIIRSTGSLYSPKVEMIRNYDIEPKCSVQERTEVSNIVEYYLSNLKISISHYRNGNLNEIKLLFLPNQGGENFSFDSSNTTYSRTKFGPEITQIEKDTDGAELYIIKSNTIYSKRFDFNGNEIK